MQDDREFTGLSHECEPNDDDRLDLLGGDDFADVSTVQNLTSGQSDSNGIIQAITCPAWLLMHILDHISGSDSDNDMPMDWRTFTHPISPPPSPSLSPSILPSPLPPRLPSHHRMYHTHLPADFGHSANLLEAMETDEFQTLHVNNLYYPFASRMEWELASWLSQGLFSQKAIDQFLHLEYVSCLITSFAAATNDATCRFVLG
jgi:hypothetical protein